MHTYAHIHTAVTKTPHLARSRPLIKLRCRHCSMTSRQSGHLSRPLLSQRSAGHLPKAAAAEPSIELEFRARVRPPDGGCAVNYNQPGAATVRRWRSACRPGCGAWDRSRAPPEVASAVWLVGDKLQSFNLDLEGVLCDIGREDAAWSEIF